MRSGAVAADDRVIRLIRRLADGGLFIGLAAWTQPSLVGPLYLPSVTSADERLQFYASRYPITEVDSSFYPPLPERTADLWVQRTRPGFLFDVKAFSPPHPPSDSTVAVMAGLAGCSAGRAGREADGLGAGPASRNPQRGVATLYGCGRAHASRGSTPTFDSALSRIQPCWCRRVKNTCAGPRSTKRCVPETPC
jgi:hypothetical protein